jgi:nitrogen regulatory protein PII 2
MKEVCAIIRMNKINATKEALVQAGFSAFTAMRVSGRGKRTVNYEVLQAMNRNPDVQPEVLATLSQGPRLMAKRMITLLVPDRRVADAVDVLIQTNQTGTPGDGKVFVCPVLEIMRIRTGETNEDAIDEMAGGEGAEHV